MSELIPVCKVGDVQPGEGLSFKVKNRVVAIFNVDGQFYAIDDACPHMGASLSAGHFADCVATCPLHGWRFDVRDGTWCDNPRVATDAFAVTIRDDEVLICLDKKPGQ